MSSKQLTIKDHIEEAYNESRCKLWDWVLIPNSISITVTRGEKMEGNSKSILKQIMYVKLKYIFSGKIENIFIICVYNFGSERVLKVRNLEGFLKRNKIEGELALSQIFGRLWPWQCSRDESSFCIKAASVLHLGSFGPLLNYRELLLWSPIPLQS